MGPLSSFLFILGMEALSRLISKEEMIGNIHGIKISRHSPLVLHILYVDDLMVFSRGNASEASCIMKCLSKFSTWYGQQVNMAKSSLFISKNCSLASNITIKSIFNLRQIPSNVKHLGLPLFFPINKSLAFEDLRNKIPNKILGWKSKLFSQATHTTLIKSVANLIPSYHVPFPFAESLLFEH